MLVYDKSRLTDKGPYADHPTDEQSTQGAYGGVPLPRPEGVAPTTSTSPDHAAPAREGARTSASSSGDAWDI